MLDAASYTGGLYASARGGCGKGLYSSGAAAVRKAEKAFRVEEDGSGKGGKAAGREKRAVSCYSDRRLQWRKREQRAGTAES